MAHLAQAYIHLKPYSASNRKLRSLGRYAERIAKRKAAEIYGRGVIVEIELEEGSLKTRIAVVGSLLLAGYGHVADYKSFKDSVAEMCDDAREFAVDICNPYAKRAGVGKEEIYRFEKRLKTPGKLYRISKRLERLERSATELSPRDIQKELARMRADLDNVAADLSDHDLKAIQRGLKAPHLPPPQRWPVDEGPPKNSVQKLRDQPSLFDGETELEDHSPKGRIVFRARAEVTAGSRRPKQIASAQQVLPALKD